jgi:hypothetical protein
LNRDVPDLCHGRVPFVVDDKLYRSRIRARTNARLLHPPVQGVLALALRAVRTAAAGS